MSARPRWREVPRPMICWYAHDARGCIEVHQNGPDVRISWSLFIKAFGKTTCIATSNDVVDDIDDAMEQCDAAFEDWERGQ
jgi:hypothetical protein